MDDTADRGTARWVDRYRSPALSQAVLLLNFDQAAEITNDAGLTVGCTAPHGGRYLAVLETNGQPILELGDFERGPGRWDKAEPRQPVLGSGGALLGYVTKGGVYLGDERVAKSRGFVSLAIFAVPSRTELALARRLPRNPRWPNNPVTRFLSGRYRIDFETNNATMRCLVIGMVAAHHYGRNDE